ncbi:MAG: phosphatidate cytidylyltransferase [Fibrobacteres bacterium]|nr:phosphatidate cytidylyltransferase [Fibrobacterota bacterium]
MLDRAPVGADFLWLMGFYAVCLAAGFALKAAARRPGRAASATGASLDGRGPEGLPKGPGIARKFKVFFLFQTALLACSFWSVPVLALFFLVLFILSAWEIGLLHRRVTYPTGYRFRPLQAYGLLALFGFSLACFLLSAARISGCALPPGGTPFLAFTFLLIAVADGYAQITGQILGGPRIVPRISPGKTWSGFVGGMAFCALAAWLGNRFRFGFMGDGAAVLYGASAGVLAFLGDITASWVKRRMGIKDFSDLLGPQGGVLDRGDSLIWLGPALWLSIRLGL